MTQFTKMFSILALLLGFAVFSIDASAESGEDKCPTKCSVAKSDGTPMRACPGGVCPAEGASKSNCDSKNGCATNSPVASAGGCCNGSGESRFVAFIRRLFSS